MTVLKIDRDLEDLIPTFLKNRTIDFTNLKKEITSSNFSAVGAIGHKMAGSCGGYGFNYLGELGRKLENLAKNGNASELIKIVEEMEAHLNDVEIEYVEVA